MEKFDRAYDLIIEDIIQSVTPEELKKRQKEYSKIRLKTKFDIWINEKRMIKNEDGSYDVKDLMLYSMNLHSLLDLPYKLNKVDGDFECSYNNLTDLKGCPEIINGYFSCSWNKLTSLEGCPKEVNGQFYISNMRNGFKFKEEDIRKVCTVSGKIYT